MVVVMCMCIIYIYIYISMYIARNKDQLVVAYVYGYTAPRARAYI